MPPRRKVMSARALALALATLALAVRGAAGTFSAFAPDEPTYASSATVRAERAAWNTACIETDASPRGCAMDALHSATAEHYRTLDRIVVVGACAAAARASRRPAQSPALSPSMTAGGTLRAELGR